ncbi:MULTISPECIES: hypothetical protein [Streptomyces]|uniref:Roadblock/LAMTOR2 domain-containing protein n=1 Tax=Streptomyces mirabilis TaxID=68239 RepID=A0ABU3V774_9ACTN|nr:MULTISPECIES: hypothetical protein [Streptomyces]MCX4617634.1 hypothetical protein [Streptomyces mirabilis]MCX5356889.1 hypothetical protein [Streptomyces mirabilis]MDU9002003.1 hypothetical protein [Streptomyces mirabilis]QDN93380.1 hypothetical protein FNV61_55730 [Streptomyces sp. RLB3-6]QDO05131.1 hypothetical protein FNV68_00830 [Streptomyces sp. S1D4-23]
MDELVARVRHALDQAGFEVVGGVDRRMTGLQVSGTPAGVLVAWATSDGFAALAADQSGGDCRGGMRVAVQAAVSGLMTSLGYPAMGTPNGDLIVLVKDGEAG